MLSVSRESKFINDIIVSKRGNILGIVKAKKVVLAEDVETKEQAHGVFDKFDKSPDIEDEHIKEHKERLDKGHEPKEVVKDFFQGLQDAKKSSKTLTIRTAKLLRQAGIFKKAERDVYQNLETGDFWKISDDKKNVVRMFEEKEGAVEG